jgi:hypothetical protein
MMHQAVAGPSQANRLDKGVVKDMSFFERILGGHRLTDYQGLFTMFEKCSQHFMRSKPSNHTKRAMA